MVITTTIIIIAIIRGVMVIKQAGKTRAAQRKGALTNWKKTGRTIIKYLRYNNANIQNTDFVQKT